jgi:hypothetical protein
VLIDKLIDKVDRIIEEGRIKECIIYTSCDTYGRQAEYIRHGLNFDNLFSNIEKILSKLDKVTIVVMSTFNIFSIFSYDKLIQKIYDLKVKHYNSKRYWNSPIILDTSYLRYPSFLSFRLLKDYITKSYFENFEKYMIFNSSYRSLNFYQPQSIEDVGFSLKEIEKITRLKEYFESYEKDNKFYTDKHDFIDFTLKYDIRRNLNVNETFPELKSFLNDNSI